MLAIGKPSLAYFSIVFPQFDLICIMYRVLPIILFGCLLVICFWPGKSLVIVVSIDVSSSVQSISGEHEISWSWLGSHSSLDRSSSELVVPMLGSWAWIVAG